MLRLHCVFFIVFAALFGTQSDVNNPDMEQGEQRNYKANGFAIKVADRILHGLDQDIGRASWRVERTLNNSNQACPTQTGRTRQMERGSIPLASICQRRLRKNGIIKSTTHGSDKTSGRNSKAARFCGYDGKNVEYQAHYVIMQVSAHLVCECTTACAPVCICEHAVQCEFDRLVIRSD